MVSIASIFATISWISSGRASSEASDYETSSLGFMMVRLESEFEYYSLCSQVETNLVQARVALIENYPEGEWEYYIGRAENLQLEAMNAYQRAQSYAENVDTLLDNASELSGMADSRSTAAITFSISAIVGSCGVLIKRKELFYISIIIFAIAACFLLSSVI
jgi:hypothetical protein